MACRALALAALALLSPVAVAAETVTLRTGEHGHFTRMVFTLPVGTDWRVGRAEGGYVLDLGDGIDFDLSGAFERIPRARVAGLEPGSEGRLAIRLACGSCYADAFLFRPDRLVVDIADGTAPEDSEFEARLDAEDAHGRATVAERSLLPVVTPRTPTAWPTPIPGDFGASAEADRLAEAEQGMIDSLARAASLGVVVLDGQLPSPLLPDREPPAPPVVVGSDGPGLQLRSANAAPEGAGAVDGERCLPADLVDPSSWLPEGARFGSSLAEANAALTGELGRIPEGAVEALARTYIHFGFGAEARATLRLDNRRSFEREVLGALALLVDGDPVGSPLLIGPADCPGPGPVWTVLAQNSLDGFDDAETRALALTFQLLPPALQGHLGGRLAHILAASGAPHVAEAIQQDAEPAVTGATAETAMAGAEVALGIEGPDAAIKALEAIVADEQRLTPEALVQLIELTLSEGRPVSDSHLALAAALRFETRGEPQEAALAIVEARGLIAAGRFEEAMDLSNRRIRELGEAARAELRDETVRAMAERAAAPEFLERAMAPLPPGVTPWSENAVGRRLLDLGFADRAAALLAGPAEGDAMQERRRLRARAALLLEDPAGALEALRGLDDPEALALIARAEAMSGDPEAVARSAQTEAGEFDPTALWRAGDWERLGATDDPLLESAARAVLSPSTDIETGPALASRQALLSETEATRQMIDDLLNRFAVEAGDEAQ